LAADKVGTQMAVCQQVVRMIATHSILYGYKSSTIKELEGRFGICRALGEAEESSKTD